MCSIYIDISILNGKVSRLTLTKCGGPLRLAPSVWEPNSLQWLDWAFNFLLLTFIIFCYEEYKRKRDMKNIHQLEMQLQYSKQWQQITTVHGIFLLLLTLDLGGLPSNLLFCPPSTASPSSPPPLSDEQPLLPGERWPQLERGGIELGLEQCRCWAVSCTG